ncbi:MAG: hypothetical protein JJE49_04800, partial [Peptostreptococcaceae bacterium]|nr:hypothetical protein [Peptostreptococcaceae bacterium]
LLGNENINWRTILYLFAKRYLKLSKQISGCEDKTRALIFDDSPLIFLCIASEVRDLMLFGRNSARRKAGQAEAAYQEHKEKHPEV